MRLTSFTDYCLRVLICVAAKPNTRTTIAEVANTYGISEHHLTKVVHFLGKAGFLQNVRGRGGGLELARDASRINIGDVVREAEGAAVPAACFEPDVPICTISKVCRLRGVLEEAVRAFDAVLNTYTLADLVQNDHSLRRVLFSAPRVRIT